MKARRRVSAGLLLAVVAVTAGCGSPQAVQGLTEPGSEVTDFAFIEGTEAAGVPAPVPVPEQTSTFFGVAQIPSEVLAARERFPEKLPDGAVWSDEDFRIDSLPRDAVIEEGVYDVAVSEYWLCAWMGKFINAEDTEDRQRTADAVTELEKYPTLPAIVAHHQSPEAVVASVIQPAKHGDSSTLREFFKTCTSYQRANPD